MHEQYHFVLTVRLQSDPVGRRLGQYRQMSDGRFSISANIFLNIRENIENHEPSARVIWHQSIRQNSKHSGEAENSVPLDTESFLGDIDSITQNESSTNVSDHVAGYICHKQGWLGETFRGFSHPNVGKTRETKGNMGETLESRGKPKICEKVNIDTVGVGDIGILAFTSTYMLYELV